MNTSIWRMSFACSALAVCASEAMIYASDKPVDKGSIAYILNHTSEEVRDIDVTEIWQQASVQHTFSIDTTMHESVAHAYMNMLWCMYRPEWTALMVELERNPHLYANRRLLTTIIIAIFSQMKASVPGDSLQDKGQFIQFCADIILHLFTVPKDSIVYSDRMMTSSWLSYGQSFEHKQIEQWHKRYTDMRRHLGTLLHSSIASSSNQSRI